MNEALAIELSRLEAELHLPAVRADGDRVRDLLHAEFEVVGRSGQFHSREATRIALKREAHLYESAADAYVATKIGTDVALLTHRWTMDHDRCPNGCNAAATGRSRCGHEQQQSLRSRHRQTKFK